MGHLGSGKNEIFLALARRLDQNPVGAPLNETLMRILHLMYSEQEAAIGSKFPLGFTTADRLAAVTGLPEAEVIHHLNNMANKGLVIDFPRPSKTFYALAPLVIGFFEYTFMRVTSKVPMPELAALFELYHRDRAVAHEFFGTETKMFNTRVYESLMQPEVETEVLNYERASEMIRDAGGGSLSMCYCRHQAAHRGLACAAPVRDVCTSLGRASEWLVRRGFARPATTDELLRVLERTEELGLVHLADNVQKEPAYICHCCGCCCGVLRTINEHQLPAAHPSNFLPQVDAEKCVGCGVCTPRCHVGAIAITVSGQAVVNTGRCLGCGACVRGCPHAALLMKRRQDIYVPPRDKKEQMQRIAREKGKTTL